MSVTTHQFISFDETPIFYRKTSVIEGSIKALAIIVHGMGEHGGRYQEFAHYLSGLGIESYLPDLRGFGKSGGKRACVKDFSDYHRDLGIFSDFIARNHKEQSIFLIGHSLGGLIVSSYLAFNRPPGNIKGLVLSSPLFGIAMPVPYWKHAAGILMSTIIPDHSEPTHVDSKLLTHDGALLEEYAKDRLIFHHVSARLYKGLTQMIGRHDQIAESLAFPTLLLQAGEDHIVSKKMALRFYDHLKSQDKELEIYENFFHEILNETNRESVYSRIGLWIHCQVSYK